jgi:hypothetical protein
MTALCDGNIEQLNMESPRKGMMTRQRAARSAWGGKKDSSNNHRRSLQAKWPLGVITHESTATQQLACLLQ